MVVGSGAREHTLVWKLASSRKVKEIYAAPGNAGTAQIAHNLDIQPSDVDGLAKTAQEKGIELAVVGPEASLAGGIVDHFQSIGIPIFGPSKAAAEIESSKVFSKTLMQKHGIPCAKGISFSEYGRAKRYIEQQTPPIVVKADGLAAGKGVTVARSIQEAIDALYQIMEAKIFGAAGDRVIIEECLTGKEMSSFAFTDGSTVIPLVSACDYKPIFDGNRGPNTGGMGSYSPPYFTSLKLEKEIAETILKPAVKALAAEKRPYKGVLYGGLMITEDGPKVIEFNARFGDPETQVVLPLLETDLVDILQAIISGNLDQIDIEWSRNACVGVVMTSGGYPGSYRTGFPISGLYNLDKDIMVFHAGTRVGTTQGQVLSYGGRVLTVAATGKSVTEAREKVYQNISRINFEGCHYRKDIALV
ncbi:MAG: phosphoribosylamine--glycine ligase [Dehalococcoidales bacterium]|nr:phosphoribosylamine--glycine ligase [Dehalococcoidales bacterium]